MILLAASMILLNGPIPLEAYSQAGSPTVNADPPYSSDWKPSPNVTAVSFSFENGTDPDGHGSEKQGDGSGTQTTGGVTGGSGSGNGSSTGTDGDDPDNGGGGAVVQPGVEPNMNATRNALGPLVHDIVDQLNGLLGHGGTSPMEQATAMAKAEQNAINNGVPKIYDQVDSAITKAYGPSGSINPHWATSEADSIKGNGDCIFGAGHAAQVSAVASVRPDEFYRSYVKANFQPTIDSLAKLSSDWNGKDDVLGEKYVIGGADWSFDEASFITRAAATMRSVDDNAIAQGLSEISKAESDQAAQLGGCAERSFKTAPSNEVADHDYKVKSGADGRGGEIRQIQERLLNVNPDTPGQAEAKYIGLRSVRLADQENSAGNGTLSDTYIKIAQSMLDISIGFVPGLNFARDVYEAVSGYSLTRGERLTSFERVGAIIGVISGGLGDEGISVLRALDHEGQIEEFFSVTEEVEDLAKNTDSASVIGKYQTHAIERMEEAAGALKQPLSHIEDRVDIALDEGSRYFDRQKGSLVFAESEWPSNDKIRRLAPTMDVNTGEIKTVLRAFF